MSPSLVIVGMSGGVDSSVAAWLLQQQGYDVQGLFMSNWDEDEDGYCTAAQDYQDARSVCEQLGIPLHRVSFAGEYRERVFAYFLEEYRAGPHTESGCAVQSRDQVRRLLRLRAPARRGVGRDRSLRSRRARAAGASPLLLKGVDTGKDQSYFLHAMPAAGTRAHVVSDR